MNATAFTIKVKAASLRDGQHFTFKPASEDIWVIKHVRRWRREVGYTADTTQQSPLLQPYLYSGPRFDANGSGHYAATLPSRWVYIESV